jgi:hypothetical protein
MNNEQRHDLHSSQKLFEYHIKKRWAGNTAGKTRREMNISYQWSNLTETKQFEDAGVERRVTLK